MSLFSLLPDTSRRTADLAAAFVMEHPEVFREFIDASLAQEYPISMRASRVVYLCGVEQPDLIKPFLDEILQSFPSLHDQSVIRNFLHIFEGFAGQLNEAQTGLLLKLCFNYIDDLSQSIAVRTYSLKLLYLISRRYPEIKPEIITLIHFHSQESTAAFIAQSRQILQKLNKEIIPGR